MMRVKIKDFQSIEEAELTIDGFTVVVGRSNIGKSAVVRAVEGALTNLSGDSFVRLGAHHTEVELDCPDLQLTWKKGGGFNDYVINGEVFESVGRGAPPVIAEAGFREVEVSRASIPVQVASQFNPIFLLDPSKVSGSLAAEVVSDIGRLGELQEALRNASKDRRSLETVQRVRHKDLKQTRAEIQAYDALDEDLALGDNLRDLMREVETLQSEIKHLEELSEEYRSAREEVSKYQDADTISLPEWKGDSLYDETRVYSRVQEAYQEALKDLSRFDGLDNVTLPEWEGDASLKRIAALGKFQDHVLEAQGTLGQMGDLPDLPKTPDLGFDDLHLLERMQRAYHHLKEELPKLQVDVERLDRESKQAHDEVHELLEEAGICPLCEKETA